MNFIVLLGRILFALLFIMSGPSHFSAGSIGYAASHGVPLASIAVPLSGVISALGGLGILLGFKARWGAWLIVLFLVPVTLTLHPFWSVADPQAAMIEQIMFMKNVTMLGAALVIAYFGSGPLSLDNRLAGRVAAARAKVS